MSRRLCKWCGCAMLLYKENDLMLRCQARDGELCEAADDPPKALDLDALENMAMQATAGLLVFSLEDGTMVVAADLKNILELIERARRT